MHTRSNQKPFGTQALSLRSLCVLRHCAKTIELNHPGVLANGYTS